MSESCAATRRACSRRPRSLALARPILLVLAAVLLPLAIAQQAPTLTLGSYSYIVGETLELSASNLEPGGSYRIELTAPAGGPGGANPVPLVSVQQASEAGTLRYTAPLQRGGTYSVSVSGPRLDATLNVQVSGADEAVGQAPRSAPPGNEEMEAPPSEAGPQDATEPEDEGAPTAPEGEDDATEPEGEAPGATQPDDDAPGATAPGVLPPGAAPETEIPGVTPPDTSPDAEIPGLTPPTDTPRDAAPRGTTPGTSSAAEIEVTLDGDSVVAQEDGRTAWRLEFPVDSGRTAGLARSARRLVVGHGNHLLELDPATGDVLARYRLPAQVSDVMFSGSVAVATVTYSNGEERTVRVLSNGPEREEPFDPHPDLYSWLRNEADVADPLARLERDPTNPWLYLALVQRAPEGVDGRGVDELLDGALATSETFYERAQLADALLSLPAPRQDLATTLMDGALDDFVSRGYRADLLTNAELAEAYGFPLGRLVASLGRGNLDRAGFWADWLYRTSSPAVPETQAALREYANYLQQSGQRDAAALWRTRANEGGRFDVGTALSRAALTVGRTGWYGVAALVVSILALHVTLLAKYWRPQSLTLQRRRASGRSVSRWSRLTFMRYATFMEKLVMVLLFAAALALAALQGWAAEADAAPTAWGSGSLATPVALESVARLRDDRPDALFVKGYALQTAGDSEAAAAAYRPLEDDDAALNNLGVLTGDEALYRRALELNAGQAAAAHNLGLEPNPSPLLSLYRPDEPVLVAPGPDRLAGALAGGYLAAWGEAFTNPWAALTDVSGVEMPTWLWMVLVALFLLFALLSIVWLFLPRPRLARNAPRTFLYHLLALLLPGTGFTDEFWGVFLMVPWAIFGVDMLLNYLPGAPDPVIALRTDGIALIVIYLLNLVAYFVELSSYRKRMAALKEGDPETAREYGMRVPAREYV